MLDWLSQLLGRGFDLGRLRAEQSREVLGCSLSLAHDGRSILSSCSPSSVVPAWLRRTQPPSAVRTTCGSSSVYRVLVRTASN